MAFVMINAEVGAEREVLIALRKLNNVKEAYMAYGVYDLLVKLEAETMEKVKEAVASLRRLDRIRSTLTIPVRE
jgi:DNA-binding Lrp family transcriptional regulator